MPVVTRRSLITGSAVVVAAVAVLATFVWSGAYNVGADDHHSYPVHSLLLTIRERSIAARAGGLQPPDDLTDPARIRQGSGNYNAMCMGCHLAPGMGETELSRGLYPAPPNLTTTMVDAAEAFWVIKHGIKASGMPAWGQSMGDEYIWNMAAFLQAMPAMDAGQYRAMVASSNGHDHGGGETIEHVHAEGTPADHHAPGGAHGNMPMGDVATQAGGHAHGPGVADDHHAAAPARAVESFPSGETITHQHADGTIESHHAAPVETEPVPAPASTRSAPPANDGHDHQHSELRPLSRPRSG